MKRLILILAAAAVLATTVALPVAYAHGGHHAVRTRRQCKKIPKRWHHLREECFECVDRRRHHHFHPGFPEGERCHR